MSGDAPIPANDDRARVSRVGELVVLEVGRVVAEDGVLLGNLVDAVVGVVASNRLQTVDATKGSASRAAILDGKQRLHVVDVEILRSVELGLGDDALDLDEVVLGLLVPLAIFRLREHKVCPLDNPRIPACGYENNASVEGERAKTRKVFFSLKKDQPT